MKHVSYSVLADNQSKIEIAGNYWPGKKDAAIILLHMMPATKESWNEFAIRVNNQLGWHVLAIDLRGHGESVLKRTPAGEELKIQFENFSDEEHQASIEDVIGARQWLVDNKAIAPASIYLGGASIGANLSIAYLARYKDAPGAFLLSPGLNYKGIETIPLVKDIAHSQSVFIAAADDDKREHGSAVAEGKKLCEELSERCAAQWFAEGGHGTSLFNSHSELADKLIDWLGTRT